MSTGPVPVAATPLPTFSTLVLSRHGHVLHVEISVGKVNAMNKAFWAECRSCFSWVGSDRHTRVVVISARGRIFSAGLDLQDHTDLLGTATPEDHSTKPDQARAYFHQREHVMSYQAAFTAIERCPQPVIAAVHGLCVGGAIDLITACDIRLCSADATFSIKEVDVGLAADVGTLARIHHVTGNNSLVRELVYTARPFSSTEAVQCGLVSRTYPTREDLMKHALELATTIANKSPVAVYGSKVFLNYARDHTIHESLDYQATWNAAALGTGDIAESVTAAMSKKTPIYSNL